MARLVVDFEALDRLQSAIAMSIEVAEQDLQTLTGQVRTLADRWSGAAAEGFQRTVSDWLAARQDLQQQLEYLRTLVVTAHYNHAAAVAANMAMWQV